MINLQLVKIDLFIKEGAGELQSHEIDDLAQLVKQTYVKVEEVCRRLLCPIARIVEKLNVAESLRSITGKHLI